MPELKRIEEAKKAWNEMKHRKGFNAMNQRFTKPYSDRRAKALKGERQPIEVLECQCSNKIRMFNKYTEIKCFSCNRKYKKINDKWELQKRDDIEVVNCPCGNVIKTGNFKDSIICYRCGHYLDKINGKWERSEQKSVKGEYTIEDQLKEKGIVVKIKVRN